MEHNITTTLTADVPLAVYVEEKSDGPGAGARVLGEDLAQEIATVNEDIAAFALDMGVPQDTVGRAQVVIDEILANSAMHSNASGISVRAWTNAHALTVEVSDDGDSFDPLTLPAPDVTAPVEEREIGGLGIHLARNLAEDLQWEYRTGRNVLTATLGPTRVA